MKRTLISTLCATVLAAEAWAVTGNPQVTMRILEQTPSSFTLAFTPNADVRNYYCCQFDHGTIDQTLQQLGPMFGLKSYADMIMAWGYAESGYSVKTWSKLASNTPYDIWVQCTDKDGIPAEEAQCFTVSTIGQGGTGVSVIDIQIGEYGEQDGYGYQWVTYTPNDQTDRFYDLIITQTGYEQNGGAAGVTQLLKSYYTDPQTRDRYAQFKKDVAQWSAEPATAYHACALGLNANGEWGQLTDIAFRTPGEMQTTWWGYGDGQNHEPAEVGDGSSHKMMAAVQIPQLMLKAYDGARIPKVRFAVEGTANDVTYFVTTNLEDISNYEHAVGQLTAGWHEVELPAAYIIDAKRPLYVGYTATGSQPIALASKEGGDTGSCLIAVDNDTFTDYGEEKGWTLGIQVMIESKQLPNILKLDDMGDMKVLANEAGSLKGRVYTTGAEPVTSYTVALSIDSRVVQQQSYKATTLQHPADTQEFSIQVPALRKGPHEYTLEITNINGQPLPRPEKLTGVINAKLMLIPRVQVVEEITGTWCGWCIEGIVGMQEMRKKYPDSFIGIAIHYSAGTDYPDPFEVESYKKHVELLDYMFPRATMNRKSALNPSFKKMEASYLAQDPWSDGEIKFLDARYTDDTHKELSLKVRTRFAENISKTSYRIAFVIVEDHLPALQTNYYAGGEYGPMGGYENQQEYVAVDLMDVAREIRAYNGIINSVPSFLMAGQSVDYSYRFELPENISDRKNISVIALLQNVDGTEIYNAARCSHLLEPDESGIEEIHADEAVSAPTYNLQGMRDNGSHGIRVSQGIKTLVK